ncbi:hypothetical protein ACJX0J_035790 [Zea mays]
MPRETLQGGVAAAIRQVANTSAVEITLALTTFQHSLALYIGATIGSDFGAIQREFNFGLIYFILYILRLASVDDLVNSLPNDDNNDLAAMHKKTASISTKKGNHNLLLLPICYFFYKYAGLDTCLICCCG